MKLKLLTLAVLFASNAPLQAQEEKNRFSFPQVFNTVTDSDSSASFRWRKENKTDGSLRKNQGQTRVDWLLTFGITPDGKLKLKSRVQSGAKFDSAWNATSLGVDDADPKYKMSVRQFYADYSPNENLNVQAGALPVIPAAIKGKGVLSIDTDGWVDGARASYANLTSWASQISVTVGQVQDYTNTNFFARGWGSPNFVQVHVQGDLSKRLRVMAEGTHLEDDQYLRGMLEIFVTDIVTFVDSVVIEDMIKIGSDTQQGFAATLKKAVGNWKMAGGYSFKDAHISSSSEGHLLLEDVYRQGHQVSFNLERAAGWGSPYFHTGKTVNCNKFLSNCGLRVEGGIKLPIKRLLSK